MQTAEYYIMNKFGTIDTITMSDKELEELLINYGETVIDECATTFRYEWDCQDEHDAIMIIDSYTVNDVRLKLK